MIFIEIRKSVATGDNNSMSFWAHFDVLRGVLFRVGALVVLLSVLFFIFMPQIFNAVILAPCNGDFPLYKLFDAISGATEHSFEVFEPHISEQRFDERLFYLATIDFIKS